MAVMTSEDYVRAFRGNVKNWSWDISPAYKVEREEAQAVADALADYEELKAKIEEIAQLPFFYHLNIEAKPVKVYAHDQIMAILKGGKHEQTLD